MPRLLSISHSYVVGLNRRILQAITDESRGRWEVVAAVPSSYHTDLRWMRADPPGLGDRFKLEEIPVAFSRSPHFFVYAPRLRKLLRSGFDVVHAWEEPYVLAATQIAAWTPSSSALVFA